ncbi:N-acetyltransferase [Halobacteriovorax sp. RZ-1]|uniref:GNAT family N-acetyltransferase n=1 Tax=unclassified Halobacteriovorax TaxID=2639665 RepID=UPI0037213F9F
MNIRTPSLSDVDKLFQIEIENYGEQEATEKETFQALVEFPEDYIGYELKVLVDTEVIGFYCTVEEDGNIELVDIAVSKDFQGRGHGSTLLEECLKNHAQMPLSLTVREDNYSAIALYKKFGFKQTEIEKDYYDDCNGLRFEKTDL